MFFNPGQAYPIITAPGLEGFADDVLATGGSEAVVWTQAGLEPVTIRAIVRQYSATIASSVGTIARDGISTILVSAAAVQGIAASDIVVVRGTTFKVSNGGVWPDGFAMVKLELREVTP